MDPASLLLSCRWFHIHRPPTVKDRSPNITVLEGGWMTRWQCDDDLMRLRHSKWWCRLVRLVLTHLAPGIRVVIAWSRFPEVRAAHAVGRVQSAWRTIRAATLRTDWIWFSWYFGSPVRMLLQTIVKSGNKKAWGRLCRRSSFVWMDLLLNVMQSSWRIVGYVSLQSWHRKILFVDECWM